MNTKEKLNEVVKALSAKDRSGAVEILSRYGALTTPQVKPEDIPAVHADFIEALKKFDGAPQ